MQSHTQSNRGINVATEQESLLKVPVSFLSTMAVMHIASWASSVVLGIAAVWIRSQETQSTSFFGFLGFSIWMSLPFPLCGALSVIAGKSKSESILRWFMLISFISILSSLAIAIYSGLALANEAANSTNSQQIIVAGITAFVSFLEIILSSVSFIVCFNTLGLEKCFSSKPFSKNRHSARIGMIDEMEPGHVAVMALPARQAAELFLAMYRPNGNVAFVPPGFEETHFGDLVHRHGLQDEKRRHRRRTRRSRSRTESPGMDYDIAHSSRRYEETDSDEDLGRPKSRQTNQPYYSHGKGNAKRSQDNEDGLDSGNIQPTTAAPELGNTNGSSKK